MATTAPPTSSVPGTSLSRSFLPGGRPWGQDCTDASQRVQDCLPSRRRSVRPRRCCRPPVRSRLVRSLPEADHALSDPSSTRPSSLLRSIRLSSRSPSVSCFRSASNCILSQIGVSVPFRLLMTWRLDMWFVAGTQWPVLPGFSSKV